MTVIQYDHVFKTSWKPKIVTMSVIEENKGKHKANCLCFQGCALFKPNEPDNCHMAQELYELDVAFKLVTPVWECATYKEAK